jgi:hypothetical protein
VFENKHEPISQTIDDSNFTGIHQRSYHVETEPDSIKINGRSRWLTLALREKLKTTVSIGHTPSTLCSTMEHAPFPSTYKCVDPSRVRHLFQQMVA